MKAGCVSSNMEDVSLKEANFFQYLSGLFHGKGFDAPLDNPEAFNFLYEQNYLSVYRYLYGLHGGPPEDIEDMAAETFFHAWKARRTFSGDPLTAGTGWLFCIARRLVIDAYRHEQARIQSDDVPLDEIPHSGPAPESLILANEQHQTLWSLLQHLPDDQREILVLRYMLGWHVAQIGKYLEISENTVSVRIHRTLERLQQEWPQEKE
jgi:RNA polymerase sigma-70 factor, ECF subfamily